MKPAILAMVIALALRAQAQAPKFEVVSIKPCAGSSGPRQIAAPSPGRLSATCISVANLIGQAYFLYANGSLNLLGERLVPIEKGPAWLNSELYTIEAKAERPASGGEMRGPMLRALLEDRFNLKIHSETREGPIYNLTVAKDGAKLQPAEAGSCLTLDFDHPPAPPAPGKLLPPICKLARITPDSFDIRGVTMAEFSVSLARGLDREVIDKTGISGVFDIHVPLNGLLPGFLSAPPPPPPGGAATPPPPPNAQNEPGDALYAVQTVVQKLGLKLEPGKGPSRFLVIDHVERPSAN